ncbi:MAG: PaaI family thioesterase [Dethiobacter sp.]|jgi:acyl-coenzyme A thioesterase PaaI-like protein|nr:PaaI family thioesterase [Dethiobacter sp.]
MRFVDDNRCFACGEDNSCGLKLKFYWEDDKYYTDFYTEERFQGYNGILHGGITSTIMDEIMAQHLTVRGLGILTASMEIRYRKQIPTGVTVRFESWQKEQKRNIHVMAARAILPGGEVAAVATAKFMQSGVISSSESKEADSGENYA